MKSHDWDTIVIGAGVGGLTAAAKLVRAGLRVLVLERNTHPGGTAYVYQRQGFTFPMGPLGFSHRANVQNTLRDLGAGHDPGFHRVHYRLRAFHLDLPLSLSFDQMWSELAKHFPEDGRSVQQFFHDVEELVSGEKPGKGEVESALGGETGQIPVSEYLQSTVKDWRLRRILGSLGTREPYSVMAFQAAMWNLMSREGIWYPEGGMRLFCDRLTHRVTGDSEEGANRGRHGDKGKRDRGIGVIRLRTEVKKIRVNKDKGVGVTLDDGTEMDSATVVSNADYKTTFLRLLEPSVLPSEWTRAVSAARQTGSVLQVCLGVNEKEVDLSCFDRASRLIYRRDDRDLQGDQEVDWDQEAVDPERLAAEELEVSLWSREDKRLAPDGGAVIVIRTEAPYAHFSKYHLSWRKRTPAYAEYKLRLAKALVHEIKDLIPGLEGAFSVMDVATPLTFEDQGGRSEGAVAGWSWDCEDSREWQPRELVKTPIRGLYMAGYQAFSALFMGGIPTAMESGNLAADAVLQNAGPVEEVTVPQKD
ncbi:MAG: NAD(P)/FAD-dependent oxidoreductase [Desulfobacterales bacterium]|nr:NAD(P)/FAD-dependent oxidoreductase [Desulfobacterales bacterium]